MRWTTNVHLIFLRRRLPALSGSRKHGTGAGNGNFTTGQVYDILIFVTATFRSNGANDGWVNESGEDTNRGGSLNATDETFYVGDNALDRQFRAFLHFPTATLPDEAVIVRAVLKVKLSGSTGTDPFTTHQNIAVDIRYGPFGGANALQVTDFQAAPSQNKGGIIRNASSNNWYTSILKPAAFPYISLIGVTQFRLRFQLDDNDDLGADTLQSYRGDHGDLAFRPRLEIQYYLP